MPSNDESAVPIHPLDVIRSPREPVGEKLLAAAVWSVVGIGRAAFAVIPAVIYHFHTFESAIVTAFCLALYELQDGFKEMVE